MFFRFADNRIMASYAIVILDSELKDVGQPDIAKLNNLVDCF